MIEQRTRELIHGAIDGCNSPAEQDELQQRLADSAAARQEYAGMRALCAELDAAPSCDPPPGLRDSILARIPQAPAVSTSGAVHISSRRPRRAWMGAAVALAATVAGVAVFLVRAPELQPLDPAALVGTIGQPAVGAAASSLDLASDAATGAITLRLHDAGFTLEIDLDTDGPVSIFAVGAGTTLALEGFVPLAGSPARVSESANEIRVLHSGNQRYALVLSASDAMAGAVDLAVYDGDRLINSKRLDPPAQPR